MTQTLYVMPQVMTVFFGTQIFEKDRQKNIRNFVRRVQVVQMKWLTPLENQLLNFNFCLTLMIKFRIPSWMYQINVKT